MFEIKKEPRMEWIDLVGALLIYLGALLFIIVLHLFTIDNTGDIADVFRTTFIVCLWTYIGFVIFGMVGAVIHLLKWLTWYATTSAWEKKKLKGGLGK